jgi:penicillin amidase
MFYAPPLPPDAPLRVAASAPGAPAGEVEIFEDAMGVPHVFARSETDLAYGLGFVHARDRLFQITVVRAAAYGRLAELFGEALLDTDRRLRLISWGIADQYASLGARDRGLMESYAAGVNDGARQAGKSAEMAILGLAWESFTGEHALAVARLQAWDLASDFKDELARSRIAARIPDGDPRRAAFLAPMWSGGVPIVEAPRPSSEALAGAITAAKPASTLRELRTPAPRRAVRGAGDPALAEMFAPGEGASNSWIVHGSRTASGHPVLCNDPHLRHSAPGVFYLAHLEAPGFTVAGATFPGLPAVLIGHTRHLAWGMTTSVVDMQDTVRIERDPTDPDAYLLDGAAVKFTKSEQVFRVGRGEKAREVRETHLATEFGPVVPPGYDADHEEGETLALMWPAFWARDGNAEPIAGFWDLARAGDIAAASAAVEKIAVSAQNVSLAFTDGTIAYRLAALAPVRKSGESTHLPRDGRTRAAGWDGVVPAAQLPQLTNPERGFIVTANQRVVESDGPLGRHAADPYRARRITERVQALLAERKPGAEELLAIQQDAVGVDAREFAPLLGRHCPESVPGQPAERVTSFCAALRDFRGAFEVGSRGALAYAVMHDEIRRAVLETHFGEELLKQLMDVTSLRGAVDDALREELAGRGSPLFDDPRTPAREGLAPFVATAAARGLNELAPKLGGDPSSWWWGRLHRLSFRGPLAAAPVIGGWFATEPVAERGHRTAIRSERGLPVTHGSALRMVAELTTPPTVRIVIDTGQSGHPGHAHWEDQAPLWRAGKPFRIPIARDEVERAATGKLVLLPAAP